MRLGIRLQIVLALSGLLLLAFIPLFFAVANLTRATMRDVRETGARALGRAVAVRIAEARRELDSSELASLLKAETADGAVGAIVLYDRAGQAVAHDGDETLAALLPAATADRAQAIALGTRRGAALAIVEPSREGPVAALLRTDEDADRAAPLVRLVGLYTTVVAAALLLFAYMAMTRLIVRPIDALSAAAERVAKESARALDVPRAGAAELVDLGSSLAAMTAKLRADEERMREQIAELERRAHELRAAQDRLVRSERLASVGRLSAGLAHEIGNPIAALLGLEDLLLEGGLEPAEQRDFLVRIRAETERIHRIVRDLLAFARPVSLAPPPADEGRGGDVVEAAHDVLALMRPQRSFRNVEVTTALPDAPLLVQLGREHLVQVLLNLMLNAADATGPGGTVALRAERRASSVRIEVEDNGPGVAAEVAARLFEPFVTTKEVGKGTGLGLAVCRGLVESAGGTIVLDETFSPGARFVIDLPAAHVSTPVTIPRPPRMPTG